MLQFPRYDKPVDSARDVLDRDVVMYIRRGSMMATMFKTSPFPDMRRVWKHNILGKGGRIDWVGGRMPPHIEKELVEGKAITHTVWWD